MYKLLLLTAMLVASPIVHATIQSEGPAFSPDKGLDVDATFEAQRSAILAALGDGTTYRELSTDNRGTVHGALDRISAELASVGGVDNLGEDARVRVFNDQELINGLLTGAREDSRVVCVREKQVGSHRHVNKCRTVADIRRERESSRDILRQGYGRNRVESD